MGMVVMVMMMVHFVFLPPPAFKAPVFRETGNFRWPGGDGCGTTHPLCRQTAHIATLFESPRAADPGFGCGQSARTKA